MSHEKQIQFKHQKESFIESFSIFFSTQRPCVLYISPQREIEKLTTGEKGLKVMSIPSDLLSFHWWDSDHKRIRKSSHRLPHLLKTLKIHWKVVLHYSEICLWKTYWEKYIVPIQSSDRGSLLHLCVQVLGLTWAGVALADPRVEKKSWKITSRNTLEHLL